MKFLSFFFLLIISIKENYTNVQEVKPTIEENLKKSIDTWEKIENVYVSLLSLVGSTEIDYSPFSQEVHYFTKSKKNYEDLLQKITEQLHSLQESDVNDRMKERLTSVIDDLKKRIFELETTINENERDKRRKHEEIEKISGISMFAQEEYNRLKELLYGDQDFEKRDYRISEDINEANEKMSINHMNINLLTNEITQITSDLEELEYFESKYEEFEELAVVIKMMIEESERINSEAKVLFDEFKLAQESPETCSDDISVKIKNYESLVDQINSEAKNLFDTLSGFAEGNFGSEDDQSMEYSGVGLEDKKMIDELVYKYMDIFEEKKNSIYSELRKKQTLLKDEKIKNNRLERKLEKLKTEREVFEEDMTRYFKKKEQILEKIDEVEMEINEGLKAIIKIKKMMKKEEYDMKTTPKLLEKLKQNFVATESNLMNLSEKKDTNKNLIKYDFVNTFEELKRSKFQTMSVSNDLSKILNDVLNREEECKGIRRDLVKIRKQHNDLVYEVDSTFEDIKEQIEVMMKSF